MYKFLLSLFAFLFLSMQGVFSAPVITSLNPAAGSTAGGTIVTINGSGFTGATAVNFGILPAASFTVNNDTSITATSPAHSPQVITVSVTAPSGTSAATSDSFYTYQGDGLAYVANLEGGDVTVLDTTTDTVVATTGVGTGPFTLAVTPDATKVYVGNTNSNNVSVIDTATQTVITTIPTGSGANVVLITTDGTKAYVSNQNTGDVSVIDTNSNTVMTTIEVGTAPLSLALTPNNTKLYVGNLGDGTVTAVDVSTSTVLATITVGTQPSAIVVIPDGTKAYVANLMDDTVSVINTATDTVTATIPVGDSPGSMAALPDGTKIYVPNSMDSTVSVIDVATDAVVNTITVGNSPQSIAINSTGTRIYVANADDNTVSVVDSATDTVIATVGVGSSPSDLIVTPDDTKVYVANFGVMTLSVISTTTNTVIANPPVGILARAVAMMPDQAPLAKFVASLAMAGLPSTFDASASNSPIGTIVNYSWDFGDGSSLDTPNPVTPHTYATGGSYTVTLTVTNSAGTSTQQVFIFTSNSVQGSPTVIRQGGPTAITTQLVSVPFAPVPVITAISPTFGPLEGGTQVTITGLNFTGATTVFFGSIPVSFVVNSDTSITVFSPPGVAGIVDIRVVTPFGISALTSADQFTYVDAIPLPPRNLQGEHVKNEFATQTDIVNVLRWKAPRSGIAPVSYRIYRNSALTNLVAEVSAHQQKLHFKDHNRKKGKTYTYFVVSVDALGQQSTPAIVKIKG